MEPSRDKSAPPMGKSVDAVIRFFEADQELTEAEFLSKHPEDWVRTSLEKARATSCSRPCLCHGRLSEFHVVGTGDGFLDVEVDCCEEEAERLNQAYLDKLTAQRQALQED